MVNMQRSRLPHLRVQLVCICLCVQDTTMQRPSSRPTDDEPGAAEPGRTARRAQRPPQRLRGRRGRRLHVAGAGAGAARAGARAGRRERRLRERELQALLRRGQARLQRRVGRAQAGHLRLSAGMQARVTYLATACLLHGGRRGGGSRPSCVSHARAGQLCVSSGSSKQASSWMKSSPAPLRCGAAVRCGQARQGTLLPRARQRLPQRHGTPEALP